MQLSIPLYLRFAQAFDYNFFIAKSWWEHKRFADISQAMDFFESHKNILEAKPFIKWVGGKRQLIPQLEKLFPMKFHNDFEPFVGGGTVFFNLHKEKSFLSDVNLLVW